MKCVGSTFRWVGVGVFIAALSLVSAAQAAAGKAVVRSVQGTASYSEQGGEWKPLKSGKALGAGSVVKTGVASHVVLSLEDNGPVVRVAPDSTLGLDKLDVDKTGAETVIETQLDLRQGTIQGVVNKLAAASRYEVKTPNSVTGIRGTPAEYQISADSVVHVRVGSNLVAYTNPVSKRITTHQVNEGQTFVPPSDPSKPDASATVRATREGEWIKFPVSGEPLAAAEIVIPATEIFVSPLAGRDRPESQR